VVSFLLWGGAVLALAGLWWPGWIAPLVGGGTPLLGLAIFRTPVVTYLGYIILWVACIMVVGIGGSASGYAGWVGLASVVIVLASSVVAHAGGSAWAILLLLTIGAFLATLFIYWTMAKVAEIRRTVKRLVWTLNSIAFILGIAASVLASGGGTALLLTYAMAGIYTLTWLVIAISVLPSHYRYMVEKKTAMKESGA